jgi:hypothetical protein
MRGEKEKRRRKREKQKEKKRKEKEKRQRRSIQGIILVNSFHTYHRINNTLFLLQLEIWDRTPKIAFGRLKQEFDSLQ